MQLCQEPDRQQALQPLCHAHGRHNLSEQCGALHTMRWLPRLMSGSEPSLEHPNNTAGSATALVAENTALRAQVRRVHLLLNSAIDHAIITLDRAGCITSWNAGAERILGYAEAEILGRPGEIVFTAEDRVKGRFNMELCRATEAGSAINERWHVRRDGTRFWASGTMLPLLDETGRLDGFLNILRDRTHAQAEAERRALLMDEMNHRIKNTFATVQAVAAQTMRHTPDLAAFRSAFDARLQVLSRSQDVLIKAEWDDTPLRELIESALAAYGGEPGRISIEGPPVLLAANLVVMVSLAFHELTTNAAKYGALSMSQGRVAVTWTVTSARPSTSQVSILWRERDGPLVQQPERRGFGSQLLEKGIAPATVHLDFQPEGLECRICLPAPATSKIA